MSGYSVPQSQIGRPTAWWGMTILIASEATLFAALIACAAAGTARGAWPITQTCEGGANEQA